MEKQPNIDELKKRMEQSRLNKLRGDLDQLIESDPKTARVTSASEDRFSAGGVAHPDYRQPEPPDV
nr:motility protein B [Salmonella sp. NCTC 7297]